MDRCGSPYCSFFSASELPALDEAALYCWASCGGCGIACCRCVHFPSAGRLELDVDGLRPARLRVLRVVARALDPVLPHVADDFSVSIAAAASFAAVFAFTFAIMQPVLGAAADLFGKARLMIVCLVLLGLANILGAMATSFRLLFAPRILAGIGSGGVFPFALSLTSDLVGPEKRQSRSDARSWAP